MIANLKFDEDWLRKFGESEQVSNASSMVSNAMKTYPIQWDFIENMENMIGANCEDLENILLSRTCVCVCIREI